MCDINPLIPQFLLEFDVLGAGIEYDSLRMKTDDIVIIGRLVPGAYIQGDSVDVVETGAWFFNFNTVDLPFLEANGTDREVVFQQLFNSHIRVPFRIRACP